MSDIEVRELHDMRDLAEVCALNDSIGRPEPRGDTDLARA